VADSHFLRDGEPKNRPRYRIGDLLLVYLTGVDRCPAILEVTATAAFDPETVDREARAGDGGQWGWVTPIAPVAWIEAIEAPTLADVGIPGRDSNPSIRP
jgi:hypothetical protein